MSHSAPEDAAKEGGMPHSVPIALPPRRAPGPITVLLVDDDDQVRGFCRSLLTENGLTVLEAHDGLEALLTSIQHQGAIDLLITDVVMPGISGIQLGRIFKDFCPSVNVLYVSASPRDEFGNELPAECVCLTKPFAPDELVDAVADALVSGHDTAEKPMIWAKAGDWKEN
jgi:CheY-like chemotaxis protein